MQFFSELAIKRIESDGRYGLIRAYLDVADVCLLDFAGKQANQGTG